MELNEPLSTYATRGSVDNVVVFVSDSLRYDELPGPVADRGVRARTISPSTFTGSSIPSMFTGRYPTRHRVWDFSDRLPARPTVFDAAPHAGYDVRGIWSWPLDALRLDSPDWKELKKRRLLPDIEEPFTYVLHDKGGHVPYGSPTDEWDSVSEFFAHNQDSATLRSLYRDGVDTSTSVFFELLETLEERGLLERTLVVFTSDHGELLGSHGGLYGHGVPMVPELVRVPTVFMGAGLPANERYDPLVSGVDIAPTLLGALGTDMRAETDGVDLWNAVPSTDRRPQSHIWQEPENHPLNAQYQASSAWDWDGGHVIHHNRRRRRCGSAIGQYFGEYGTAQRSWSPRDVFMMMTAHLPRTRTYGDPGFEGGTAERELPTELSPQAADVDVTPDEEQLRKLGYM